MEEVVIVAPLYVMLPRKRVPDKKVIINLNNYRNWHHIISNDAKKMYKTSIMSQIEGKAFREPIRLKFQLYRGSNRKTDKANVLSIHEKFFCDALVECGCITDDSDEYIEDQYYAKTEFDKENPRVEITIMT